MSNATMVTHVSNIYSLINRKCLLDLNSIRYHKFLTSLGYDLTCEYSCDGGIIRTWDDGSDSKYGTMKDIYSCKEECDKHEECGGFSMIPSSGICGHWKRGPIALTQKWGTDRDCYMKK